MKKSNISFSEFCDSFSDSHKNNFSYAGKRALYEYLENYEEETGEEIELDTIALCCDYSEYESATEAADAYTMVYDVDDVAPEDLEEEKEKQAREWIEERTTVIVVEGGRVIIAAF